MSQFEQTQEAQEYLSKLQAGRLDLPKESGALENEALKNLREIQQKIRQATTSQGDLEKQIKSMEMQQYIVDTFQRLYKRFTDVLGKKEGYKLIKMIHEATAKLSR